MAFTRLSVSVLFPTVFVLFTVVPLVRTYTAPLVEGPGWFYLQLGKNATMYFTYRLYTGRVLNYVTIHRLEGDEIGDLLEQSNEENPNGRFSIDTSTSNNSFTFTITDVQPNDDGVIMCMVNDGVEEGGQVVLLGMTYCNVTSFVNNGAETTCKSDCLPYANVSILVNSELVASGSGSATTSDLSTQVCMNGSGICVADNGMNPVVEVLGCDVIKTEDLLSIGLIAGFTVGVVLIIGSAIAIGCHCRNRRRQQWMHTTLN
ncbi:uncharacterized protein LOC117110229 isoform X2 [Anneissia japonica]|uniref:uncharacterized protein LOC117110229 isoform X2 n=1 Tax=Anneissia japonica TaxID=1529436 RepID=UPI001425B4CD|nr:uncharacterized protein LOC117110229 isoform X2 [Anneissia japonica]